MMECVMTLGLGIQDAKCGSVWWHCSLGCRGHDVPLAQVTEVHNINNYWSVVSSVGHHSGYKVYGGLHSTFRPSG